MTGMARADVRQAGRRRVVGPHHVELRDELPQVVLPVGQEAGAQPREFAQALDRLVGCVTWPGPPPTAFRIAATEDRWTEGKPNGDGPLVGVHRGQDA